MSTLYSVIFLLAFVYHCHTLSSTTAPTTQEPTTASTAQPKQVTTQGATIIPENISTAQPTTALTMLNTSSYLLDLSVCDTNTGSLSINASVGKTSLSLEGVSKSSVCRWAVFIPDSHKARIQVTRTRPPPYSPPYSINVISVGPDQSQQNFTLSINKTYLVYSFAKFKYQKNGSTFDNSVSEVITFDVTEAKAMKIRRVANSSTFEVTSPDFEIGKKVVFNETVISSHIVQVPENYVAVVVFTYFDITTSPNTPADCANVTRLIVTILPAAAGENGTTASLCAKSTDIPLQVFNSSVNITLVILNGGINGGIRGMRLEYTVLPSLHQPQVISENGTNYYNCSVPHFEEFRSLFSCNLQQECYRGEDEEGCVYTHSDCERVEGITFDDIDDENKCYKVIQSPDNETITWYDAKFHCQQQGGLLVTMASPQEWQRFLRLVSFGAKLADTKIFVGLSISETAVHASVGWLYTDVWRWVDDHAAYYHNLRVSNPLHGVSAVCAAYVRSLGNLIDIRCDEELNATYICEFAKNATEVDAYPAVDIPIRAVNESVVNGKNNASLTVCASGSELTKDFLACDEQGPCVAIDGGTDTCPIQGTNVEVPMYQCSRGLSTIHYTLVCDHRAHCLDYSDEDSCDFQVPCHPTEYQCRNQQCIDKSGVCDGTPQCDDDSDENCRNDLRPISPSVPPPAVIWMDGKGGHDIQPLNDSELCPETHFPCTSEGYCIPVYLRCNEFADCPGREDEVGCDDFACPGFYRCRKSNICLHPDNVCDGIVQCPQHDDELLCDNQDCPENCFCQGLAFVCKVRFSASSYRNLRFVDASGSGMIPDDFGRNFYMIRLHLQSCNIIDLTAVILPNLQHLDLSHNAITTLKMDAFFDMKNLQKLILDDNPLTSLIGSTRDFKVNLFTLSMAFTHIEVLDGDVLKIFPDLFSLNISHSRLTTIKDPGLTATPRLKFLDLRDSPLLHFPGTLLKSLGNLDKAWVDNYKLCCAVMLPPRMDEADCVHEADHLASCEDLVSSDFYRACLWVFAALAIVGNAGSFVTRFYLNKEGSASLGSFGILVTNLSIADFFMGIYLAMIGVADQIYRGSYMFVDDDWKKSVACKVAGFLSLLSSEVSAFIICLITLDRFLVLRFPFSRVHFNRKTAMVACGVVWAAGVVIAAIPLLPMAAEWNFYGQSGICIPLPFSGASSSLSSSAGYSYSFSVIIVLNFILFLLIAVGQVVIYWSVRANSMRPTKNHHGKKNDDGSSANRDATIARRLTTIVVSDFLCWFPIGVIGLLAATTDTAIPPEVNVGVAVLVLPFNSALNPFLYTFNILMEKKRRQDEAKILKRLEMRHFTNTEFTKVAPPRTPPSPALKTTATKSTMTTKAHCERCAEMSRAKLATTATKATMTTMEATMETTTTSAEELSTPSTSTTNTAAESTEKKLTYFLKASLSSSMPDLSDIFDDAPLAYSSLNSAAAAAPWRSHRAASDASQTASDAKLISYHAFTASAACQDASEAKVTSSEVARFKALKSTSNARQDASSPVSAARSPASDFSPNRSPTTRELTTGLAVSLMRKELSSLGKASALSLIGSLLDFNVLTQEEVQLCLEDRDLSSDG